MQPLYKIHVAGCDIKPSGSTNNAPHEPSPSGMASQQTARVEIAVSGTHVLHLNIAEALLRFRV